MHSGEMNFEKSVPEEQAMFDLAQASNFHEPLDLHRNAPVPDPACLYGLIGDIGKMGSEATEANPYAIALNALVYLSCVVGRGPYMPIGDTWHHARLFGLHIGRSGIARKGDAVSLVLRIAQRVRDIDQFLAPQIHRGGLSSREGLVFLIHDGYKDGKNEVPPMEDKRLLVVESEFVNVLHQGKRDGNTLSAALRDCWDGVSLRPATKGNRLWASDPHVCLLAAITPSELLACVAARDLSNGFINRFLPIWAERSKILPFPEPATDAQVEMLAARVREVLDFCGASRWVEADRLRMNLSPAAEKLWEEIYYGELNDRRHGERINALIERRAPMLQRIAMLLALTDCSNTVEVSHLNAARAWIHYSVDSVKYVFASSADEADMAETNETAAKILAFVRQHGRVTRSQLTSDCFSGHASARKIDAGLDQLLTANPPQILVTEIRSSGRRSTKFYQLPAIYANNEHPRKFAGHLASSEQSEIRTSLLPQSRIVRTPTVTPQAQAAIASSHTSHSSHTDPIRPPEDFSGDDIEVSV